MITTPDDPAPPELKLADGPPPPPDPPAPYCKPENPSPLFREILLIGPKTDGAPAPPRPSPIPDPAMIYTPYPP